MDQNKHANGQTAQVEIKPGTPAKKETAGNPNDPRWLAGDQIEEDNERKLGKAPGPKQDKTGR
ncbi:MAG: hypothetical protein ACO1NO_11605 [Burkholderiaceae bacterium]